MFRKNDSIGLSSDNQWTLRQKTELSRTDLFFRMAGSVTDPLGSPGGNESNLTVR
jgi:hypothetical protein